MSETNTNPVGSQAQDAQAPAQPQPAPEPQEAVQPELQPAGQEQVAQPQEQGNQAQAQAQAQQAYGQPYAQQPYAYAYPYAQAPQQPKKTGTLAWVIGGVVLFFAVATFVFGALSCSSAMEGFAGVDSFEESSVFTEGASVAVIDIAGTIQYDGTSCSPEGLADLLDEAEANDDIKAVVLRVDSGGGTATAGEEMAQYVANCTKPIVVSSASMNCSAAYELSSQADYIFVNQTTAIGAIGTVMQVTDISGLLDMLGVRIDNIASAESKDSSYGTRSLTEEERAYYQDLVDTINETFIQNVAKGRGMKVSEVRELATGMEFAGVTAVENGLADEIGIYDDALDKAAELGGIKTDDYYVVSLTEEYYDMSDLMYLLGAQNASDMTVDELLNLLEEEGISA